MKSLKTFGSLERTIDTEDCIRFAIEFAKANSLEFEFATVGKYFQTYKCYVTDIKGNKVEGSGKGLGQQSKASAIFEALEHYFYSIEDLVNKSKTDVLILDGKNKQLQNASPDLKLIFQKKAPTLSFLEFYQIRGETSLFFPTIFTNPDFEGADSYEQQIIETYRLARYSSNSGTASGMNIEDSILHGLLEVIERDSISIELLNTVINKNGFPVREIDSETLPIYIREIYELAIKETNGEIKLYNITSDLGIASILCSISYTHNGSFCIYGSGASLWISYAIERAILEAVQGFHIQNLYKKPFQQPMYSYNYKMSLYQKCFLDEGYFSYRYGVQKIKYSDIVTVINQETIISCEEQINVMLKILDNKNIVPYFRTIKNDSLKVVQVLVPILERFFLVSHGIPVAPSYRGKTVLNSSISDPMLNNCFHL